MKREEAKFFGGVSVNVSSFLIKLYLGILGKRFEICMTTSTRSILTILWEHFVYGKAPSNYFSAELT